MNLLEQFFNHKSDANKYLNAEQQEDLENDFNYWLKTSFLHRDERGKEIERLNKVIQGLVEDYNKLQEIANIWKEESGN